MLSLTQHLQLEVACPACDEFFTVPVDTIRESQRQLDELGPCSGMASFECPAPYFASLASPDAIARLQGALREFERDALRHGTKAVWVEPDSQRAHDSDRPNRIAAAISVLALELASWENEGGAGSPST